MRSVALAPDQYSSKKDQEACILQFHTQAAEMSFNSYTQPAVKIVTNICSMQIDLLLIFFFFFLGGGGGGGVDTLHSIRVV